MAQVGHQKEYRLHHLNNTIPNGSEYTTKRNAGQFVMVESESTVP